MTSQEITLDGITDDERMDDMNTTERGRAFLGAVEANLRGIEHVSTGPCPGCEGCGLGDVYDTDDPRYVEACETSGEGFSWRDCDSCGSRLGGSREPIHGFIGGGELWHGECCTDCLMYHANGDIPEDWC